MDVHQVHDSYNKYNPISKYAIRPVLKLVNAHNNPLRGGVCAAIASGLAHYGLAESIKQAAYFAEHSTFRDNLAVVDLPAPVHILFGINMLVNVAVGFGKHLEKKVQQ